MRYTDVDTFISVMSSANEELVQSYVRVIDNCFDFKNEKGIKEEELIGVLELLMLISDRLTFNQKQAYFFSLKNKSGLIEQFDILRFTSKSVLNIEIKSEYPDGEYEDIKDQLLRHKHILNLLNKNVHVFTFVASDKKLYSLDSDVLVETDFNSLISCIEEDFILDCELDKIELNSMIISPYSQAEEFASFKYYLTADQKRIKNDILRSTSMKFCIIGGPGTGKSLILFDLAYEYKKKGKKVVIIFGSNMSDIESSNISQNTGIKVVHVKKVNWSLSEYDVVMIDESQRIWRNHIDFCLELENKIIIFSLDKNQTLHKDELARDNQQYLLSLNYVKSYNLKDKIRTDPAMSSFILKFLHYRAPKLQPYSYDKVKVVYFDDKLKARDFIDSMNVEHGFVSIELTQYVTKIWGVIKRENIYDKSISTHNAVGREYSNVLIPLDEYMYHDENGMLKSSYNEWYPYIEYRMIFQALTRVRDKLLLVVIKNPNMFIVIEKILNWKDKK